MDLYVSILCTHGFTCTINIKTICQYIMYSTRGFICQYIMYYVFFQVDVIVNSSNIKLEFGRGAVSKSILEKGGRSILDECKHRFPHGINYGQVVCTKAGIMNFKFICHSALPHWTPSAKYSIKVCISH